MRLFHRNGIFPGESGAASLAGFVFAAVDRGAFLIKLASRVVLLSTEGITVLISIREDEPIADAL